MIVLDTDHVTLLGWAGNPAGQVLRARLDAAADKDVRTTVVTYEEQTRGWMGRCAKARTVAELIRAYQQLLRHLTFYRDLSVLGFDERAAVRYQELRAAAGRSPGTMDLRIASIVLANDALLLSRNLRDFRRIAGLKVDDWTRKG